MKEAMFFSRLENNKVQCGLCPWECVINDGNAGNCGVRQNKEGKLYSLVYGHAVSTAVDPIEKKPLFHFAPGTQCLSIATAGCNLKCQFCQNYQISQEYGTIYGNDMAPEQVIELAKRSRVQGIAYTYTEPTIFFEYALDIMKLAKKEGLYNVWVSNGYTNPGPVKTASKYLDAINVDLKGNDGFYWDFCGGKGAKPVHESLKEYRKNGVFIEVTNLLIPTLNDRETDIAGIVEWVKKNLGRETPIHFSAFYPQYKARDIQPTPPETVEKAIGIAKERGMKWVYGGNVRGKHENTICHKCGAVVIRRRGFSISSLKEKCPKCGGKVGLKGMEWTGKI